MKKTDFTTNCTETEMAKKLADLTFNLEKICQEKEQFFAATFDLTAIEFRCLKYIRDNNNLTVKQLSDGVGLTASRVTYLITSLEKKNLLTREIDTKDRRNIRITLTANANPIIKKAERQHVCVHESILRLIPEISQNEVVQSLDVLLAAIKTWFDRARAEAAE